MKIDIPPLRVALCPISGGIRMGFKCTKIINMAPWCDSPSRQRDVQRTRTGLGKPGAMRKSSSIYLCERDGCVFTLLMCLIHPLKYGQEGDIFFMWQLHVPSILLHLCRRVTMEVQDPFLLLRPIQMIMYCVWSITWHWPARGSGTSSED
jgi:hypothetical protein